MRCIYGFQSERLAAKQKVQLLRLQLGGTTKVMRQKRELRMTFDEYGSM